MPSYRLLRSNKESGPYSLNDLVTLGLKPYDLVWVDGRSAAWRYPSEIAELKDYAPAIEEQPYDRFYKKYSEPETAKESTVSPREQPAPQKNPVKEIEIINQEPEPVRYPVKENVIKEEPVKKITPEIPSPSYPTYQAQPKKQVYVSMPERNNGFGQYQQEQYQQYLPKTDQPKVVQEKPRPVEEKSYSPINIQESEETKLETKYTQSLDDIKEMYVNTLVQRKTKNRRKEIIKKYVKPALVPLFLLISGVAIGYVITSKKTSSKSLQAVSAVVTPQTTPEQKNEETPVEGKILQPDETKNLISGTNDKNSKSLHPQQQLLIQPQKQNKNITTITTVPKAVIPDKKEKQAFVPDDEVATVQKKNVEVDPNTGERKRAIRDNDDEIAAKEINTRSNPEHTEKKSNPERSFIETDRKDLRHFVTIKSNNYIRGAFGGIRGLELTVYNNSGFLLDEVSVELQIMKPSEQPLRTDIITVRNISANGAVTVRVPDSQRGIRVDYRITNIESRQWQKSTAGL
jgi:hypothetical protein